jgi:nucleoside-diphosphate-sugar epimerase
MPTLTSNSGALVLVTGANGYIALHLVRELLEKGYRVRGTVRSEAKAVHLRKTFESYGDKLEIVIVEDITEVCDPIELSFSKNFLYHPQLGRRF